MHQYLKAIGFGDINTRRQLQEMLEEVEENFTFHELIAEEEGMDFCEYQKEYGPGLGISECGYADMNEVIKNNYYFPYFLGTGVTSYADIIVEKRIDRTAYVGICEDIKVGISLIFYLQNPIEYLKEKQLGETEVIYSSVTLSGLCNGGTILFPVQKDKEMEKLQQEESRNRMLLLSAAKTGDQAAIESLTLDDIDTYSKVSRRLITEDVFSIVDTYIMPYGVECDCYSIMGEIIELNTIENEKTDKKLYIMKLDVNEILFDICVPVNEVIGEPMVGRRFKGNIWMQGYINFQNGRSAVN